MAHCRKLRPASFGAVPAASVARKVQFATVAKSFTTTVKETERTAEAAHAFDYTFKGTLGVKRKDSSI